MGGRGDRKEHFVRLVADVQYLRETAAELQAESRARVTKYHRNARCRSAYATCGFRGSITHRWTTVGLLVMRNAMERSRSGRVPAARRGSPPPTPPVRENSNAGPAGPALSRSDFSPMSAAFSADEARWEMRFCSPTRRCPYQGSVGVAVARSVDAGVGVRAALHAAMVKAPTP